MKRYILFCFIGIVSSFCFSQSNTCFIKFNPVFGKNKLESGKKYHLSTTNDSINIESFKFYVSNISFLKDKKTVYEQKENFYLIDMNEKLTIPVPLHSTIDFDEMVFCIGIDSLTNVSGAMGGDLDPVNGMYWTWQSGYINFKLEGKSKQCTTRNNLFQFHIGGYLPPNSTLQILSLPVKNNPNIEITVDVERFINQIDLTTINTIMSPGKNAVYLAGLYKTIFYVKE